MSDDFFEDRLGPEDYTKFEKPKAKPNYSEIERAKAEAAEITVLSADEAAEIDGAEVVIDGIKHRLVPVQMPDGSYFLPMALIDAPHWSAAKAKIDAKRAQIGRQALVRKFASSDRLADGAAVLRPAAAIAARRS